MSDGQTTAEGPEEFPTSMGGKDLEEELNMAELRNPPSRYVTQPFVLIDPKIVKRIELIEARLEKIEEYLKKLVEEK